MPKVVHKQFPIYVKALNLKNSGYKGRDNESKFFFRNKKFSWNELILHINHHFFDNQLALLFGGEVVQWIGRWTSDLKIDGSSLVSTSVLIPLTINFTPHCLFTHAYT